MRTPWRRIADWWRGAPPETRGDESAIWAAGTLTSSAGISVTPDVALTLATVYRCVALVAQSLAALPLHVYMRGSPPDRLKTGPTGRDRLETGPTGKDRPAAAGSPSIGKTRLDAHPVTRLLHDRPNPDMTAIVFRDTMTGHVLTWGNAYAEIQRNGAGEPVALWPIHPSRVTPRKYGSRRVYEVVGNAETPYVLLDPGDILHLMGLSPDGRQGYSPIAMARETLGLAVAAEKFGSSFFAHGSRPSGALEYPQKLSPEAMARIREDWQALHGGPGNTGRAVILQQGMTFKPFTIPPEDAQFLQTRKFQVIEICRWFGTPPHKVYELDRATFSNIEHQSIEFVTDTLLPWMVRWEQEIHAKLLGGDPLLFVRHNTAGILRGDLKSRYDAYAVARQWGWLSANDIRALEDQNPVAGGDVYLSPLNMTTSERVRAAAEGEDPETKFLRDVVKAFLADGTVVDVIANLTDLRKLLETVGVPAEPDVVEPFLPITTDGGPVVTGEVLKDSEGDIVGGVAAAAADGGGSEK